MNELCDLCKIRDSIKNRLWENNMLFALFDPFPVSPGHVLIITKRHVLRIENLTHKEWASYYQAIKEIIPIIESTDLKKVYENILKQPLSDVSSWFCNKSLRHPRINTNPDAYNYGINDGKMAGRSADHFHWHIIPRYEGDVEGFNAGVRFVIPSMGDYKSIKRKRESLKSLG
jgi:diadenosine tetraphosphate (Ap4A) HIT family hydrolase